MPTEPCTHPANERIERTANGFLGDAPAGTVQTLCAGCGTEIRGDVKVIAKDGERHIGCSSVVRVKTGRAERAYEAEIDRRMP